MLVVCPAVAWAEWNTKLSNQNTLQSLFSFLIFIEIMTTNKSSSKKKKIPTEKINNLKKEIEELKKELEVKNDKLLRSIADFQNYQKRMEKEIKLCENGTKKKYLIEILDIYDLLKKAVKDNDPKKGLKLIIKNLEQFIEKEQIKKIDCIGKKFDHNIHHAVTIVEKNDCDEDTIVEEVKKGYMINDELLRPSHVIVSKKKQ